MEFSRKVLPNELLNYERERRQWTQEDVAIAIGAPDAKMVGKWERGVTVPSPHYRRKLEALFGKSGRELGFANRGEIPFWYVPYRQNLFFTGREALLLQLHTLFASQKTAFPLALCGLGGMGKTQTALEYAYRYHQDYHTVAWLRAYSREVLEADVAALAAVLNLTEKQERNQQVIMDALTRWFSMMKHWLLIIDNADDLALLDDFLPTPSQGHILLTTRTRVTGTMAQAIDVDVMEQEEGASFLLRRAKVLPLNTALSTVSSAEVDTARAITHLLGGLPLALDQAGAYIEETACSLTSYLERYPLYREAFLHRRGTLTLNHPEPVGTTWSLAFEKIQQAHPAAIELLCFLAFLAADGVPEELVLEGATEARLQVAAIATQPLAFDEAIEALRKFSLIQRDPQHKLLSLHRLVQVVLLERMDEQTQRLWAERVVRAINRVFPSGEFATWQLCERLLAQALAGTELIARWNMCLPEAAQLLQRTGRYQRARARFGHVEQFYRQALAIQERLPEQKPLEIASLFNDWGELYFYQSKPAQAEPLFQHALALREQFLDAEDPCIAESLTNVGIVLVDMERYTEAEVLYQRALGIRHHALGREHPDTAASLRELGYLFMKQGKYSEAEQLLEESLHICEKSLEPDNPLIGVELVNLAGAYREQGKYSAAETLYLRAIALWERTEGPDDPDVAYGLNGLAKVYIAQEDYTRAEPLYQRAYAIFAKVFGPKSPGAVRMLHALTTLYETQRN